MRVVFKHDDIAEALISHAARQVLITPDSNVTVEITAGRKGNGHTATIDVDGLKAIYSDPQAFGGGLAAMVEANVNVSNTSSEPAPVVTEDVIATVTIPDAPVDEAVTGEYLPEVTSPEAATNSTPTSTEAETAPDAEPEEVEPATSSIFGGLESNELAPPKIPDAPVFAPAADEAPVAPAEPMEAPKPLFGDAAVDDVFAPADTTTPAGIVEAESPFADTVADQLPQTAPEVSAAPSLFNPIDD